MRSARRSHADAALTAASRAAEGARKGKRSGRKGFPVALYSLLHGLHAADGVTQTGKRERPTDRPSPGAVLCGSNCLVAHAWFG
jgi:hypothetical protein